MYSQKGLSNQQYSFNEILLMGHLIKCILNQDILILDYQSIVFLTLNIQLLGYIRQCAQ